MAERLDLPEGQWVELKTRLSWGDQNRIQAAVRMSGRPSGAETVLFAETLVRTLTVAWSMRDVDGVELPLEDASWARLDGHVGDLVARRAFEIWDEWRRGADPNA